ncbi:MAG: hypothetical protein Q9167_007965 [Letrouitia subvulpina]
MNRRKKDETNNPKDLRGQGATPAGDTAEKTEGAALAGDTAEKPRAKPKRQASGGAKFRNRLVNLEEMPSPNPEETKDSATPKKKTREDFNMEAFESASLARAERMYLFERLKGRWLFARRDEGQQLWFEWCGTHWRETTEHTFTSYLRLFCEDVLLTERETHKLIVGTDQRNFYANLSNASRVAACKDSLSKNLYYLKIKDDFKELGVHTGINFKNGFYLIEEKKLVDHPKDPGILFQDCVCPFNFEPDAMPSPEIILLLYQMVGYNDMCLWLLRTAILRAILPDIEQQTGYLLHGESQSGKTSFSLFISYLLGKEEGAGVLSMDDFKANFMVTNIAGKRVTIMPELEGFTPAGNRQTKMLMGRDLVSGQRKFEQKKVTFVYYGTLLCTTNKPPAQLVLDEGMRDRLLMVEFKKYGERVDPSLLNKLIRNAAGLVNWALQLDQPELSLIYRAKAFNYGLGHDESPVARFITQYLVFDKNSYVSKDSIVKKFNANREELGYVKGNVSAPIGAESLVAFILTCCKDIWSKDLTLLKQADRPWFLSPEEAASRIKNDGKIAPEKRKEMLSNDFLVPLIRCAAKKGQRLSVIAGLRPKYRSDESLILDLPEIDINVNPFGFKKDSPRADKWAQFEKEIRARAKEEKEKLAESLDYIDPGVDDS